MQTIAIAPFQIADKRAIVALVVSANLDYLPSRVKSAGEFVLHKFLCHIIIGIIINSALKIHVTVVPI